MAIRTMTARARQTPGWLRYLAFAPLVLIAYLFTARIGDTAALAQSAIYNALSLTAVVALLVGSWRFPTATRLPWVLLAAGESMTLVGNLLYFALEYRDGKVAYPGITEVFYMSAYPLYCAGLLLLVRRRTPGWDTASRIDAGVVAISAGLLSWIFLITPIAFAADSSVLARAVTAAFPMMDLLLLVFGVRLMLGAGVRTTAFWLLVGWLAFRLAADTLYSMLSMTGSYKAGSVMDVLYLNAMMLFAAVGMHPSMKRVDERSPASAPDATPGRVIMLAAASLIAPVAQLIQYLRGEDVHVLVVSGACIALFLLVLARMVGLVTTQRRMAITDGLTGLHTRRYFEQVLRTEVERTRRGAESVGILLFDVDLFKRINDTYGHHAGDRVLCEIARRLSAIRRSGDVVCRYGGEEFAVLLPHINIDELAEIGEQIRRAVVATPIAVDMSTVVQVTVSVGAALAPDHAIDCDELVRVTDQSMYAAKNAGRNQTAVAGSLLPGRLPAGTDAAEYPGHAEDASADLLQNACVIGAAVTAASAGPHDHR